MCFNEKNDPDKKKEFKSFCEQNLFGVCNLLSEMCEVRRPTKKYWILSRVVGMYKN